MDKKKYIEDLQEIKSIMNRSSRFISLSGISGIIAGILALIGAYLAFEVAYKDSGFLTRSLDPLSSEVLQLLGIAMVVLILSILSAVYFTQRNARKNNQKLWDDQSRRLLINMFIPLATGGILCLIFLMKGYIGFIAPFTLLFYGLALVNASKYTLSEIRGLGIAQIVLGLVGSQFIGYGLFLWAFGFGILHIIYGVVMYKRYGS